MVFCGICYFCTLTLFIHLILYFFCIHPYHDPAEGSNPEGARARIDGNPYRWPRVRVSTGTGAGDMKSNLSGKAKVMITGGFDNISEEGSYEFTNMKATILPIYLPVLCGSALHVVPS